MGYFDEVFVTEDVPLQCGYAAVVRALDTDQNEACRQALIGHGRIRGRVESGRDGEQHTVEEADMDNTAYALETVLRGTVSWTLTEKDGAPIAITKKNIGRLHPMDAGKLFVAIRLLTDKVTDPNANRDTSTGS